MQDLPEKTVMLEALARFLEAEVRPVIADAALGFRVRIAAHLAGVVAREIRAEDGHDRAELERLEALLGRPGMPASTRSERVASIRALNAELASAIRAGTL